MLFFLRYSRPFILKSFPNGGNKAVENPGSFAISVCGEYIVPLFFTLHTGINLRA